MLPFLARKGCMGYYFNVTPTNQETGDNTYGSMH